MKFFYVRDEEEIISINHLFLSSSSFFDWFIVSLFHSSFFLHPFIYDGFVFLGMDLPQKYSGWLKPFRTTKFSHFFFFFLRKNYDLFSFLKNENLFMLCWSIWIDVHKFFFLQNFKMRLFFLCFNQPFHFTEQAV